MIDQDTYRRYRFFKENDGWCSPPGRAACALRSARSEQTLERAIDLGVASVEWEYDNERYDPGDFCSDEDAARKFDSGAWTGPYGCVVKVNGEWSASLWGIVFGPNDTDDPYARCVVADLAAEAEDEIRQAIGDAEDAAQGIMLA